MMYFRVKPLPEGIRDLEALEQFLTTGNVRRYALYLRTERSERVKVYWTPEEAVDHYTQGCTIVPVDRWIPEGEELLKLIRAAVKRGEGIQL